jgi:hypothetical protein
MEAFPVRGTSPWSYALAGAAARSPAVTPPVATSISRLAPIVSTVKQSVPARGRRHRERKTWRESPSWLLARPPLAGTARNRAGASRTTKGRQTDYGQEWPRETVALKPAGHPISFGSARWHGDQQIMRPACWRRVPAAFSTCVNARLITAPGGDLAVYLP